MTFAHGLAAAAIFLLVLVAGLLTAGLAAVEATSPSRMHELERRGSATAARVRHLLAAAERTAGAVQIGTALALGAAGVLAGWLGIEAGGPAGLGYAALVIAVLAMLDLALPRALGRLFPDRLALL